MPSRVPEDQATDRLERYASGEPIYRIAADHGVCIEAIINFVRRHEPWLVGQRPRGRRPGEPLGVRREWFS